MEDKYNFRQIILSSVEQLKIKQDFFNELQIARRPFSQVALCGMGGSALAGDFFNYFRNFAPLKLALPFFVHRDYGLPPNIKPDDLIVCVSYSGNTEETLSVFYEAQKQNIEIAAITANGRLAQLCQAQKIPWVKIHNAQIPPRCSLGYQLNALVKIFMAYGLLTYSAQNEIEEMPDKINPAQMENEMKLLCPKMANKIPVIYSSRPNEILAKIFKIKINENSKIPAFFNVFPELNHNEMVGWTKNLGPFYFIFLRDANDPPSIKERFDLTTRILNDLGLSVTQLTLRGENPLIKLFRTSIMADWLSYHLALFYGFDPTPVVLVEEFKRLLKN